MKRMYPRVKFTGNRFADRLSIIFAETLEDLLEKVEMNENPPYPKGFIHASTIDHEGACYYNQCWSRDAGRGVQELARLGFVEEARLCADYFLSFIRNHDHWGRTIDDNDDVNEIDGNAHILNSLYQVWKSSGYDKALGVRFVNETEQVFTWLQRLMEECPYGYLAPCRSELSGNPEYGPDVYAIYPNYGIWVALCSFEKMAEYCGRSDKAVYFHDESKKLIASMKKMLMAGTVPSLIPAGCWLNGLDGRDGSSYEVADYGLCRFRIHKWTRQLPFIQEFDGDTDTICGDAATINRGSYEYILHEMAKGYYFRRYGFVSNTCWEGAGGRHDDTMFGYGQNYMTQAALMADDVNSYTKCIEGIARLGYDGDIIEPLCFEMNPWIIPECCNYEYYDKALDHTFGRYGDESQCIMNNPGDEGNLVQASETLKSVALMIGLQCSAGTNNLLFKPRLPWEFSSMELLDFPVIDSQGENRISLSLSHERWLRKTSLVITAKRPMGNISVRFGPYASYLPDRVPYGLYKYADGHNYTIQKAVEPDTDLTLINHCKIERTKNASWIWADIAHCNDQTITIEVSL